MKPGIDRFNRTDAAEALPRAFPAFLGRFGSLTGIQELAIPIMVSGRDAVIVAPAASGKTEAVLAPLFEELAAIEGPRPPVGILYIVPTRALANDIETRVCEPAAAMKMKSRVRTGDRPSPVGKDHTDLLITTPESFDSLLCRHPAAFDRLHAIVVDEAHLMDLTARGDQLRILIRRVQMKRSAKRPRLIAVTATVGDPAGLGTRLFGEVPEVVRDDRTRPLDATVTPDIPSALALLRSERLTKAIVFCNTRKKTEETAAIVLRTGPWPPERVMVHHASLARREREDVEKAFRYFEAGILVSTSTMELGVDIGDVDAVVLFGAPDSVASLQQRVGRGCRRRDGMRAIFVPDGPGDDARFTALMKDVTERSFPAADKPPDLSVAVQQIFSLVFENRKGLRRTTIGRILEPIAPGNVIDLIIDHLRTEGFLDEGAGEVVRASSTLMDMGERGRIHSNIADSASIKVVDAGTGRTVGMVSARTAAGADVIIGGRNWTVTDSSRGSVAVKSRAGSGLESGASFGSNSGAGAFSRYLPPELRSGTERRSRRGNV